MSRHGRINVYDDGSLSVWPTVGTTPLARWDRGTTDCSLDPATLLRSALSDLEASTPASPGGGEGPEGLTGPSPKGTWYGPQVMVPPGWQWRIYAGDMWTVRGEHPGGARCFVEARPVPVPSTEEVPLHELIGRKLPGEDAPIVGIDARLSGPAWRSLDLTPSGMVLVSREESKPEPLTTHRCPS